MKWNLEHLCMLGLDLCWPRRCELCEGAVDRPWGYVCSDCLMRLMMVPRDGLCRQCGREAKGLKGDYRCQECREHSPTFDRTVSAFYYDELARKLLNRYKFKGGIYLERDLTDLLEGVVRVHYRLEEIDLVVPMPSSLWHRLLRGYNQSALIARALARRLDLPYATPLARTANPRQQAGLPAAARRENVRGTFRIRSRSAAALVDRTVLLVDDIMTTGATLSEAASALKQAGVRRVWCATLAHTLKD